ncbi:MAG: hypothetical protein ACE5JS_03870 [Nitrospinota bacterium]
MLATKTKIESITYTLGEVANAFMDEAEEVSLSSEEAEILATTALLNLLASVRPELIVSTLDQIRKAAVVSSLS